MLYSNASYSMEAVDAAGATGVAMVTAINKLSNTSIVIIAVKGRACERAGANVFQVTSMRVDVHSSDRVCAIVSPLIS